MEWTPPPNGIAYNWRSIGATAGRSDTLRVPAAAPRSGVGQPPSLAASNVIESGLGQLAR